jgi:hypothetical protein
MVVPSCLSDQWKLIIQARCTFDSNTSSILSVATLSVPIPEAQCTLVGNTLLDANHHKITLVGSEDLGSEVVTSARMSAAAGSPAIHAFTCKQLLGSTNRKNQKC